jgi:hypothetical protein
VHRGAESPHGDLQLNIVSGSGKKHKKKEKNEGNRKRKVFIIDAGIIKL